MFSTYSGFDRSVSVSSIRRMNLPPWCRANNQLNRAVRAVPMWRLPVGLGAMRTRTDTSSTPRTGASNYTTRSFFPLEYFAFFCLPKCGIIVTYSRPSPYRVECELHGLRHLWNASSGSQCKNPLRVATGCSTAEPYQIPATPFCIANLILPHFCGGICILTPTLLVWCGAYLPPSPHKLKLEGKAKELRCFSLSLVVDH